MRLKRIRLAFVLMLASVALGSCMQNDPVPDANPAPASEYEGFYSAEQQYAGGDPNQSLGEVNLKDMQTEQKGDVTRLTLKFSLGSRYSDTDEAELASVPPYKAYCLGSPARFVLEIPGIEYWDYENGNSGQGNPFIPGVIRQIPMDYTPFDGESATTPMILYFQLAGTPAYRIEENGDTLAVELRTVKKAAGETKYYVTANAFADYQEGKFDGTLGLTPVLCDDLASTLMISAEFEKKQEAQKFKTQTVKKLKALLPGKNAADMIDIVALKGNELPVYGKPGESALPPEPVVRVGGKPKILPIVMQGGMYLSTKPDTGQMLFAKGVAASSGEEKETDAVYYLWLSGAEGEEPVRLMPTEFSFISDAQFSKDGALLAILETAASSGRNTLYVYDLESGVLRDMYEEGLQAEISDYAWGGDAKTLYAIGRSEGVQQLIRIRLDQAASAKPFTVLGDTGKNAGSIAYANNKIYYTYFPEYTDSGTGRIVEAGLANPGSKRNFAAGTDFRISADGRYMAVIENNAGEGVYAEDQASQTGGTVYLFDIETGKCLAKAEAGFVMNFVWGTDMQSLFLVTDAEDAADGELSEPSFTYLLSEFDVRSKTIKPLLYSSVSAIKAAAQKDKLLLIQDTFDENGKVLFETYALELNGF